MTGTCSNIKSLLQSAGFVVVVVVVPFFSFVDIFCHRYKKDTGAYRYDTYFLKRAFGILYMLFAFLFCNNCFIKPAFT